MVRQRLCWKFFQAIVIIILLVIVWTLLQNQKYIENNERNKAEIHELNGTGSISHPVLVSVYYEALCPDSKSFIIKQLKPAYERGARIMNVELIPYGKAETRLVKGHYEFECQHAFVECEANKIHACGIYYIPKTLEQIRYIACMMQDNNEPHRIGKECADEMGIDYGPIKACAATIKGSLLLKEHGDRTNQLVPKPSFIPTIVIDNSLKISTLPALLKNLFGEVCSQYKGRTKPDECEI